MRHRGIRFQVSKPLLSGNEKTYVMHALDTEVDLQQWGLHLPL
jgi:hypothetical protein